MNIFLPLWQRFAIALFVALVSGSGITGLRATGTLQVWELSHYDLVTSNLARPETVPDVVLLALTDADLAQWGWPVPDGQIARLAEASLKRGARAVGVDLYRDIPAGTGREALLDVLADERVVTISRLSTSEFVGIEAPKEVKEPRHTFGGRWRSLRCYGREVAG